VLPISAGTKLPAGNPEELHNSTKNLQNSQLQHYACFWCRIFSVKASMSADARKMK
jgi:hypothetical protein